MYVVRMTMFSLQCKHRAPFVLHTFYSVCCMQTWEINAYVITEKNEQLVEKQRDEERQQLNYVLQ